MKRFLLMVVLISFCQAEELFSTTVKARNGKDQTLRMWIPPGTKVVRGAIMQGRWDGLVTKGQYRKLAALWEFALIGGMMQHGDDYSVSIPAALKDLAEKSGHPEIEHIPFVTMGFSNGGWWAVNVAKKMPERTIAVAVCAMPGLSGAEHNPDARAAMQTVPVMQVNGASDGATHDWVRNEDPTFPKLRKNELPWTLAMQWKTKHKYGATNSLAFPFLQEAIRMRLPEDADARKGPVTLIPLDPEEVWMGDSRTWRNKNASIEPVTADSLSDPRMVWLLNESVARDWRAFQSLNRVEIRVNVKQEEDGTVHLHLEGELKDITGVRYYNGKTKLGEGSAAESVSLGVLNPGVYSFHADLDLGNDQQIVTPLRLYLQSAMP